MPIDVKLYRVLIASPRDVEEEREIVREEIARWNSIHSESMAIVLLPIGWETDATPDSGVSAQTVINRQLVDNCDLLIGIFWTRIGTPTLDAESGTIEEIERSAANGKRCIIYFSDKPVSPSNVDQKQYDRVQQYKQNFKGLRGGYKDIAEFRENVHRHITKSIQDIAKEDRESKAAENEARITKQAIGLSNQAIQKPQALDIDFTTLVNAQVTVKHLLESRFGIQNMEDAREKEIAKIKNVLSSPELAAHFTGHPNVENVSAIAQIIEEISTPSMFAIASIGKYGDDTSIDWLEIVGDWVERLSIRKLEGYDWVGYIKTYSGLLTFYSIGISALRSGKVGFLKDVIERQIYLQEYDRERQLVEALDPRYVFYGDVQKLIEPGFERRYTPVSDHIAPFIKDKLYPTEEETRYLDWFDLFEFLVALKSVELDRANPYFGSFTWRTEANRFIVKAFQEAALEQGNLGRAIATLFSDTQNLEIVAERYDNIASKSKFEFGRANAFPYISKLIKLTKTGQKITSYRDLLNKLSES
jgi:hypothetical protein